MNAPGNTSPSAAAPLTVRVWTMPIAGLSEAAVAPWAELLDATERARAARFVFAANRVAFIAAHALTRVALAGVAGAQPADFAFAAGVHGKPLAWLGGREAEVSFNLSHTDGLVGVAVSAVAGLALGFDLEPLARRAPMDVARRFFTDAEVAWLDGLPETARSEGFFRLWTLKEAFIKATGKGLTEDLSSFWFAVHPPVISFAPELGERAQDWRFAQDLVAGGGIAAIGVRDRGRGIDVVWSEVDAGDFNPLTASASVMKRYAPDEDV